MAIFELAHQCVSPGGLSLGKNEPQMTSGSGDGKKGKYWNRVTLTERKYGPIFLSFKQVKCF